MCVGLQTGRANRTLRHGNHGDDRLLALQLVQEGAGCIALVGSQRLQPEAMSPSGPPNQRERLLPFSATVRLAHAHVHDQTVAVLHQDMRGVRQLRPYSLALPSEPSLRIRQGPVRAVAALLAAKVHRRIALVIVVRSIANPRRLASLRPQALHRGVALDHGAVDREVIARRPLLDIGAFHHAVEECTEQPMLLEPLPVLRERCWIPHRSIQRQIDEPPVQQVHLHLLHQLSLRANRVQCLEQKSLEQHLRGDRRPAHPRVRPVKLLPHRAQHLVRSLLHRPERMILRYPATRCRSHSRSATGSPPCHAFALHDEGPRDGRTNLPPRSVESDDLDHYFFSDLLTG